MFLIVTYHNVLSIERIGFENYLQNCCICLPKITLQTAWDFHELQHFCLLGKFCIINLKKDIVKGSWRIAQKDKVWNKCLICFSPISNFRLKKQRKHWILFTKLQWIPCRFCLKHVWLWIFYSLSICICILNTIQSNGKF